MNTVSQSNAKDGFRLSQLIYDTRYRSLSIQVVATILILTLFGWLISNAINNLAALGKPIQFRFLFEPASYDINQRLIEYNSRDTHLRAAIVGLLNTLTIAILGCVTATILGVIIGVLRLSPNWLVARLMTIYIETFRNIPVLIWILIVFTVMIDLMPHPKLFRSGESSMLFSETLAITNRGIYVPAPFFENGFAPLHFFGQGTFRFSLSVNFFLIGGVLCISLYIARRMRLRANRIQNQTGVRPVTWWQRSMVIILPIILLLYALGLNWDYPALKGFNFKGGIHLRNSLLALWIALSLYTAASIAESVRAGILAVSKGQTEAAYALGLTPSRTMSLIVLPQALRVIIPPTISQYLNLTKNSSLAIAVGYMDLTGTLMGISLNQSGREMESIVLGMSFYLAVSLLISGLINWYNNRIKLVER